MLKIILLFCVCKYSVDFIPTLGGAILPALIIILVVSSPSMGGNIPWHPIRVLAANLCVMFLYML